MTSGSARAGARSGQLQRIAERRVVASLRSPAAPVGPRRPGQRRRAVERLRANLPRWTATDSRAAPTSDGERVGWWTRLQQAVGLLATMATLAVAAFTWVSIQQVGTEQAITREGQITDRYNTAVTNLGNDSIDVRLGGIYALQRIMQDSSRDQPALVQVLSAYVRTHAPQPKHGRRGPDQPADDVNAALNVLTHRDRQHDGTTYVVNLAGAYLAGARLESADLTYFRLNHANLSGAHLDGARLRHTELSGAHLEGAQMWGDLTGAQMSNAYLTGADMVGADMAGTDLTGAHLASSGLVNADLTGADLTGADLTGADLTGAHLRGADMSHARLAGTKR